jgi:hypothetical protein
MSTLVDMHLLFTEETLNLIEILENSFSSVNYIFHHDEVIAALDHPLDETGAFKDTANKLFEVYRRHSSQVLSLQGVHLNAPFQIRFNVLVKIVDKVCLLGVTPMSELIATGVIVEETNDAVVYVANILHLLTELSIGQILLELEYVNHHLFTPRPTVRIY